MSRYMVNKLLWDVDRTDEGVVRYKEDPGAFIRSWEGAREAAHPPYPEGGRLTEREREAFERWDMGALYAMGANPYLLWHFVRAVFVPERMSVEELIEAYRRAVEPFGYPDFST